MWLYVNFLILSFVFSVRVDVFFLRRERGGGAGLYYTYVEVLKLT